MITVSAPCGKKSLTRKGIQIKRFPNNPLIIPGSDSSWTKAGIFNCGVIKGDDGLYRMLFRSGSREDHVYSDLGLALSEDGKNWFLHNRPVLRSGFNQHCMKGIEDPRIVKWIDGWYYIFASVYSYLSIYRVGIWRTRDFLEHEWIGILFDKDEEFEHRQKNKNAAVFPELINNCVYLIHRWSPFSDMWLSIGRDEISKNSWYGQQILLRAEQLYPGLKTGVKPNSVALAAPPIKTPRGWLVIVNVTHKENNPGRNYYGLTYSIGFVVLDLNNPRKINYIHPFPIVWPEEKYEITGGSTYVCYCCAAVDTGGDAIYVYWGAADTVLAGGRLMKEDLVGICY